MESVDSNQQLWLRYWGFLLGSIFLMILPFGHHRKNAQRALSTQNEANTMGWNFSAKNRRFLALIALFGGSQMSFAIMTAAAPFIAQDLLGGSERQCCLNGPINWSSNTVFLFCTKTSNKIWMAKMHAMGINSISRCLFMFWIIGQ